MCKPILPTCIIRNVWRLVRRICMLMLRLKGLIVCIEMYSEELKSPWNKLFKNSGTCACCDFEAAAWRIWKIWENDRRLSGYCVLLLASFQGNSTVSSWSPLVRINCHPPLSLFLLWQVFACTVTSVPVDISRNLFMKSGLKLNKNGITKPNVSFLINKCPNYKSLSSNCRFQVGDN